jgi:hypothetical protein
MHYLVSKAINDLIKEALQEKFKDSRWDVEVGNFRAIKFNDNSTEFLGTVKLFEK